MISPTFEELRRLAPQGALVPIRRELLFDRDTAVGAYHAIARPPFGFLLESLVGGEKWARWTFVGTEPRSAWRLHAGGRISLWTPDRGWHGEHTHPDPLADLDRRLRAHPPVAMPGMPRVLGGAVGYLGYDIARYLERLPDAPPDDLGLPEAVLLFTDIVLAIDNVFGRAHAITTIETRGADDAELRQRYDEASRRLEEFVARLDSAPRLPPAAAAEAGVPSHQPPATSHQPPDSSHQPPDAWSSTFTREDFEAAVLRIVDYIHAGDAFQVVLSQRLSAPLVASPFELYRRLRALNPSPYLYFLELDGLSLVGSSPEVLVRVEDERVTVRPIAGTRPRGRTEEEDRALTAELVADEKERAEHLMLVDLGRNDVGRVAEYGSVRVPELMAIEQYSHVLHMVSQVEGRLRDGLGAVDVLRACFPAGTVSGAPKIRAMQIIDELEPVRRGSYAGAVGYLAWGGRTMDTAIAIRTLLAAHGIAHVQAGAGIVADSVPAREYEETLTKAAALLRIAAP